MEILVLGSGTSHGVPMIGCRCEVCLSSNPKNRRFRPSILISNQDKNLLIDTTPELRLQSLTWDVRQVDAVFYTHTHADHLFGLDDLRRFNDLSGQEMPIYGDQNTLEDIRRTFPYIFKVTQLAGGKPRLSLNLLDPISQPSFELFGMKASLFYVLHGKLPVLAYRFDSIPESGVASKSFAYVTDVSEIPPDTMRKLSSLDLLFLDAVRFDPHPTHFGLYQALDIIQELKPKKAYLTHLSHQYDHDKVNADLPEGVELSYDGLRISLT